jgi:hypothetical protein
MSRYSREITFVLIVKLIAIIVIKVIWFSDPVPVDQDLERLYGPVPPGATTNNR